MIRVAHIADSHWREAHLEECQRVHDEFLLGCMHAEVDLIVHAGDLFHARSTPAERRACFAWIARARRVAPLVIVRGNHDAPHELEAIEALGLDAPIADRGSMSLTVCTEPTIGPGSSHLIATSSGRPIAVLALPWIDKAHVLARLPIEATDRDGARLSTEHAIERALDLMRFEADRVRRQLDAAVILVAHALVAGSEISEGFRPVGLGVEITPAALHGVGADYVALGHVHRAQHWHDGRVAYAGSPYRCDFGEPESKGWRLVQIIASSPEFTVSEQIDLSATPIERLHVEYDEDGNAIADDLPLSIPAGARVRLRYHVPASALHLIDEDALRRELLSRGAGEVALEAVVQHAERVRSTEIAEARDHWTRLLAWLQSAGIEMSEERLARLRAKLEQIVGVDAEVAA